MFAVILRKSMRLSRFNKKQKKTIGSLRTIYTYLKEITVALTQAGNRLVEFLIYITFNALWDDEYLNIFITVKSSESESSLSGVHKLGKVLDVCHQGILLHSKVILNAGILPITDLMRTYCPTFLTRRDTSSSLSPWIWDK